MSYPLARSWGNAAYNYVYPGYRDTSGLVVPHLIERARTEKTTLTKCGVHPAVVSLSAHIDGRNGACGATVRGSEARNNP